MPHYSRSLFIVGLAAATGLVSPSTKTAQATPLKGWNQLQVSPMALSHGQAAAKRQRADIVDLGNDRFVVGWVGLDRCIRANFFDVAANYKQLGTPAPLACLTGAGAPDDVGWVRASTASPAASADPCADKNNWLVFHYWNATTGSHAVKVDRMANHPCQSATAATVVTHQLVDLGPGAFPAVAPLPATIADGQRPPVPTALVVWMTPARTQFWGQFVNSTGATGTAFLILAPNLIAGQYLATPDLHYNTVSQRFVLGFGIGGQPFTNQPCNYFNMLLAGDGTVVRAPQQWGTTCDNQANGPHHTSVAFDPDPSANPNGHYVWWYMGTVGGDGKGVYTFDSQGQPVAANVLSNGSAFTYPVTALPGHPAGQSYATLAKTLLSPSYYRYTRRMSTPWGADDQQGASDVFPVAMRGTATTTVSLFQTFAAPTRWWITVSNFPN